VDNARGREGESSMNQLNRPSLFKELFSFLMDELSAVPSTKLYGH